MFAAAIASVLVLAAPDAEEAQKKLRIAWASQYEWKEHGTRNLTLEFEYDGNLGGRGDGGTPVEGRGQVLVVDGEIVRRHYEGAGDRTRETLDEHVDWIVARFVRKPFEERFKDVEWGKPTDGAGGTLKVRAGDRVYILKDDRIVADERKVGPQEVRVDFDVDDVGGGYAIVGETCGYTRNSVKYTWSRTLKMKDGAEPPVPERYVYKRTGRGAKAVLTITFRSVKLDLENPVVLDPAARDLLKTAWERRFVLPREIRIEGEFSRKGDKDLSKERWGWVSSVRGQFQVWGLDKITVALDERLRDKNWADTVRETCETHLREWFDDVRPTPFEEEFKGCGFALDAVGGKTQVVRLVGHATVAAFRIDGDAIAGRLDHDRRGAWWEYKIRSQRDGRVQILSMTIELDDKKYTLKSRWMRSKGLDVPKEIQALAWSAGRTPMRGIAEYDFKRVKASLPEGSEGGG